MSDLTIDQLFKRLDQGDVTLNVTLGRWADTDPLKKYHTICIMAEERGGEVIRADGSSPQEALLGLYTALQEQGVLDE